MLAPDCLSPCNLLLAALQLRKRLISFCGFGVLSLPARLQAVVTDVTIVEHPVSLAFGVYAVAGYKQLHFCAAARAIAIYIWHFNLLSSRDFVIFFAAIYVWFLAKPAAVIASPADGQTTSDTIITEARSWQC